jgi:formylglycine-generating enzyme required for sulfatase activity
LEWSAAVGLNNESGSTPRERSAKVGNVYPWGTQLPPPRGAGNFLDQTAKSKFNTFLISFNWPMIKGYDDGYATTAPVGSFAANQFGLFDLSGNAWEWCEDWYDSEQTYPTLRGGAWDSRVPDVLLSSYRGNGPPGIRSGNYGFRCVLADDSAR